MTVRLLTVLGARPQFIKAAMVSRAMAQCRTPDGLPLVVEQLLHTGQHFDAALSDLLFRQLQLPTPDHHLGIHSLPHGAMTGRMLEGIERILLEQQPDAVVVYGDTDSTLAGALAAAKRHLPVVHIEAGLRSGNRRLPEEINRIMTDHLSTLLCCPTVGAVAQLAREGIDGRGAARVLQTGDVMLDAARHFAPLALAHRPDLLTGLHLTPGHFILATLHRAENTDQSAALQEAIQSLTLLGQRLPVLLPLHPRTRQAMLRHGLAFPTDRVHPVEPMGYLEMLHLLQQCALVATDSGGLQKEAFFFQKPCITLRGETEWTELTELGVNLVTGVDRRRVAAAFDQLRQQTVFPDATPYGNGQAARKIVAAIVALFPMA